MSRVGVHIAISMLSRARKATWFLALCLGFLFACAPTGIYHTVQPGQTLYRIAKTYDVDERELARVNHIGDPTALRVNERLFVPGATRQLNVPATAVSPAAPPPAPTMPMPAPAKPVVKDTKPAVPAPPVVTKPAAGKPPVAPTARGRTLTKGSFAWPVKGKVLNKFGTSGQKTYKGIEIAVPEGTAVVAAAAGKVIFSGNAIRDYGNLVILEHSGNFFSVYGYNKKNLVAVGDHVGQGDRIALSGAPPGGRSPRLHFEIRQGKGAVDPIIYLP